MIDEKNTPAVEATDTTEVVGVTFREAGKTYYFAPDGKQYRVDDAVIVDTARGMEFGRVTAANKRVPTSEIVPPLRNILRLALKDDHARWEKNQKIEKEAAAIFPTKVAQHKLEMKLVDVECAFDNSKLIFYFTAESRVDFRELVKELASQFRTRIELRQIGIRDEAKMLGGIGSCGRPFCCSTFLTDFGQVSIKMAKDQNFSLNSAKISGCCGRLMCCLRFEHETYEEAQKRMPRIGATVTTKEGVGVVVETRPLEETVKVRLEGKQEAPKNFPLSEIAVKHGQKKDKEEKKEPSEE